MWRVLVLGGDRHWGTYTRTFPELLWASAWLFHATGNRSYLAYATGKNGDDFADLGNPRYFRWDDKRPGTQVLLLRVSFSASQASGDDNDGLESYKQTAYAVTCILLPDSETASFRTQGGLLYAAEWNSLQNVLPLEFGHASLHPRRHVKKQGGQVRRLWLPGFIFRRRRCGV